MSIHSQHKISELISILMTVKDEFGDLPVVYWDQGVVATFDDFAEQVLTITEDNHLYFGGFHHDASHFYNDDPNVSELQPVTNDFSGCVLVKYIHKVNSELTLCEDF
jgi:hypothetical protein